MRIKVINDVIKLINDKGDSLSDIEKEYIIQFAFKVQDEELTKSLLDEMLISEENKELIMNKYDKQLQIKPAWITQVENLLVALEMYRLEEAKAINRLSEILKAFGVDISEKMLREKSLDSIKTQIDREIRL